MTGYRANVHDYLAHYDLLVIPSFYKAHPLVLMEGPGHGKPIIATRMGGILEVLCDGQNGLLVPPGDEPALADAMTRLVKECGARTELGSQARKTYEWEFTVTRMLRETEGIYESLFR